MKQTKTILLLIFVALFALAACGSPAEEPTAVPEPVEEPAEEPTEEPAPEPTEAPVEEAVEEPAEEPAGEAFVTGNATYLQRIALQDDAVLTVQIQDVSLQDVAATVMGEESYATEGAQVPLPFEVPYDPAMIEDGHTYALSVRITDADDNLLYINDTRVPVINDGSPTEDVEVIVVSVEGSADAGDSDLRTDNLEGETITFYHFGDLSGPYAAITGPLIHGMEDAVAELNANGGIRGATVEIEFADSAGSVDEAVAIYDRYTSEDDNILLMFNYGSGEAEALASRFVEDEIPALSSGLSSQAFYGEGSGYLFGLGPIYPDQFGAFLDYAVANWDDIKPASAGDEIKLAYLSWPGAFGQGALTDETRAYAEELGVEIVIEEIYDVAPTADTTTALLNAQAAGANVIWTNTLAFGPAALMNGIGALGLQGEFILAGDNWAMDLATYAFVSDPALAVGLYAPLSYLWWNDVDHPGIQQAEAMFAANERGAGEHGVGYLVLAAAVDVAAQAIANAIDEVGFDALTGADVQRALAEMGPYEGLEGVITLDYSDGSRSPHSVQIRQIQGGPDAFNVVQEFTDTPDLRPAE